MSGLRLISSALRLPNPRPMRKQLVRAIMTPIFSPHPLSDEWVETQLAVVDSRPEVLVNMALVATGDPCMQLAQTAAAIRAPTLFVHGDSDRLVPARYARAIYEIVSRSCHAEFHELPRAGHMLHISHPEAIAQLSLDWLERTRSLS
jgi:pimeloyl-ACP methyl ester carboxylesterase